MILTWFTLELLSNVKNGRLCPIKQPPSWCSYIVCDDKYMSHHAPHREDLHPWLLDCQRCSVRGLREVKPWKKISRLPSLEILGSWFWVQPDYSWLQGLLACEGIDSRESVVMQTLPILSSTRALQMCHSTSVGICQRPRALIRMSVSNDVIFDWVWLYIRHTTPEPSRSRCPDFWTARHWPRYSYGRTSTWYRHHVNHHISRTTIIPHVK